MYVIFVLLIKLFPVIIKLASNLNILETVFKIVQQLLKVFAIRISINFGFLVTFWPTLSCKRRLEQGTWDEGQHPPSGLRHAAQL